MKITQGELDLASNAVGLLAVLCFAAPALHADKYGRLVGRLEAPQAISEDEAFEVMRTDAIKSLERLRGEWQPWKGHLLIAGTVLAGLSYVIGIFKYLFPA